MYIRFLVRTSIVYTLIGAFMGIRSAAAESLHLVTHVAIGANPISMAEDHTTRHVFIISAGTDITKPGSSSMLDARSGKILQITAVGANPSSIVIDETVHRAFIMSAQWHGTDNGPFTRGGVTVINTVTGKVLKHS